MLERKTSILWDVFSSFRFTELARFCNLNMSLEQEDFVLIAFLKIIWVEIARLRGWVSWWDLFSFSWQLMQFKGLWWSCLLWWRVAKAGCIIKDDCDRAWSLLKDSTVFVWFRMELFRELMLVRNHTAFWRGEFPEGYPLFLFFVLKVSIAFWCCMCLYPCSLAMSTLNWQEHQNQCICLQLLPLVPSCTCFSVAAQGELP